MEHRRVAEIVVIAINAARTDHPNRWRFPLQHGANLGGRGVGSQHPSPPVRVGLGDEEGVLLVPRRMSGGNIEGLEVMVVVFDFGALGHAVAELGEDLLDLPRDEGHGVEAAEGGSSPRKGDVDRRGPALGFGLTRFELGVEPIEPSLDLLLEPVDALAVGPPLLFR